MVMFLEGGARLAVQRTSSGQTDQRFVADLTYKIDCYHHFFGISFGLVS